jgi:6,7-dimethyl-8-ribityllumazine synthase
VASRRESKPARYAIVRALFNASITQALLDGALLAFSRARVPSARIAVIEVPGAFELPVAALWLAQTKKYAAIVALGCVIRGETPHFDYVAGEAARGLADVARSTGVPIAFGVLTTETTKQARARSGHAGKASRDHVGETSSGNKGFEAAEVAMAMVRVRRSISRTTAPST